MIVYLDTSAVVPILISEASSETCRHVWTASDARASSLLTYVEVGAVLTMAARLGRLSTDDHDRAWGGFLEIWPEVEVVALTPDLAAHAAELARSAALRGYDAVHAASAIELADPDLVAVSGDARLLAGWRDLGLAVLDTTGAT